MAKSFENPAASKHAGKYTDSPDMQTLAQVISTNIQKITTNVTQMQHLQTQIAGKANHLDLQDRFHRIQHQTNLLAKETGKSIKDLNEFKSSLPNHKLHKIKRERLLNDFSTVLNSFQALQRHEKSIELAQQDIPHRANQNPFETTVETHERGGQEQAVLQVDATEVDLELVHEREEAVHQLEEDISDVNNIFKDLALLVHQQGDTIDTIEANTETAGVNVEEGTEQLRKAHNYNTKARKTKFCMIGTLIAIIVIIIIVLALVYGK